jgi:trehalose 6-phosphate synthase
MGAGDYGEPVSTSTPPQQANLVVVANRLPVDRVVDEEGRPSWTVSPGGLVTALVPVMQRMGGAWVGWPGIADESVPAFDVDGYRVAPVKLTADEVEGYYEGMSNATIWPLYHDCIVNPSFHREWWDAYRTVNHKFARRAARIAAPGATVWVQDYQLQLVPQMLRALRPDLRIGFFLHIPFPPIELFMQLPWRRPIIEGLLGADLVGFQVPGAAMNFVNLARRLTSARVRGRTIETPEGRTVRTQAYPISIDAQAQLELSRSPQTREAEEQLRESLGHPKTMYLGVDRLDYTKGLWHRLKAFDELFHSGQLDPSSVVYLQLATPSRERVADYQRLRLELETQVGHMVSGIPDIGRNPIQYRYTSVDKPTLAALYRMADVCVVTPLRDGMNLVAKEYVVAHDSPDGALVLSEFAGSARELTQAYLVNPYDVEGLKAQLLRARDDKPAERRRRMRAMSARVWRHDVNHWAQLFLQDLAQTCDKRSDHDA